MQNNQSSISEPRIVEWNHYADFMGSDTVCRIDPTKEETELIIRLLREMQTYRIDNPPIGSTEFSLQSRNNDSENIIRILETDVPIKELDREQVNLLVGAVTFIISRLHYIENQVPYMSPSQKTALIGQTGLMEAFLLRIGYKGFYN